MRSMFLALILSSQILLPAFADERPNPRQETTAATTKALYTTPIIVLALLAPHRGELLLYDFGRKGT